MVTQPNAQLQISQGLANNLGKIILSGGDFDNNSYALQNNGQIVGYGSLRTGSLTNIRTMTLSGGNTMVVGEVTNNGLMTLYNTTMFTDSVTNNGTIRRTVVSKKLINWSLPVATTETACITAIQPFRHFQM